MVSSIFRFMYASGAVKFLGAFLWGIASVLLSPCGISTVPLVVGYVANTDSPSHWNAFKISCAFCLGIIVNLLLVGFITSGIGMLLGGYERFLTLITAAVFIVMGLHLIGIIRVKFFALGSGGTGTESRSLKGAVVLGVVSGLAVGPCSIGYVSPVLSLAMSDASGGMAGSILLVLCYALGYCAVLVGAGTFAQIFSEFLDSGKDSLTYWAVKVVNVLCGIALIWGGVYLVSGVMF
ncbi:MAG: cytochrome C biogenesis protein [Synergistaceae bacterium]|nr:cytochrome C biogenesis protein [Synergistaceae bacterium]